MKNLFSKLLCLAVLASAFAFPSRAQFVNHLEESTLPVGEFTMVSANGDFEVTLSKGSYGVRLTTDKNLTPYVQVYVRSNTLYLTYDEKSVPKDIKKLYKGKNASQPVFRAVVSMPQLNGIELDDNVILSSAEAFYGSDIVISLTDKAQIRNLTVQGNSITVNMKKNAQAALTLTADKKMEVTTDDKAILKLAEKAREITLNAKGNSDNALSGEGEILNLNLSEKTTSNVSHRTKNAVLNVGGSSKLILTGTGEYLEVKGGKNAEVEAVAFPVKTMKAELDGGKVNVAVEKELNVTLLGGSSLFFTGSPTLIVNKIVKSTLAPAGTVK
ncbi:MAG: DUF2807 domain-containing protein [Candidatus Cryptobacteroides sp.]|nr:DUF2807 domain-containing protein [Candidatus Cryptobacteroides sp.]